MDDIQDTLAERGKTHGDYSVHVQVTYDIKRAIKHRMQGQSIPDWMNESIDMIAHKLGRIAAGNPDFSDHWHDIAGYATLAAERCSDYKKKAPKPEIKMKGMWTYLKNEKGLYAIYNPKGEFYTSYEFESSALQFVKASNRG